MNLAKYKDYFLHLNHLRKVNGSTIFFQAIKSKLKMNDNADTPHGKILILSPHPDDDVFGCGGVIRLHYLAHQPIKTIYLTSGDSRLRETEAKEASKILGVTKLSFWRQRDGQLTLNRQTKKLISHEIDNYRPDIIYTPSSIDPHPDHFATAQILASYLRQNPDWSGQVYNYEVWSPILANRLINIDNVINVKKKAMKAHRSQLKDRAYDQAMIDLASYRAKMFGKSQYAEAFFASTPALFIKIFNLTHN